MLLLEMHELFQGVFRLVYGWFLINKSLQAYIYVYIQYYILKLLNMELSNITLTYVKTLLFGGTVN